MSSNTAVPFLDLVTPHVDLETELTDVFQRAIRTAGFIGGPMVEEFEKAFADFCKTKYAVGVNSGTDALRFALLAAGVQQGDAVITVPHTFIATTEAISQAGAIPEFVDIDERTYNMDPKKLREHLEHKCSVDESGRLISKRSDRPVRAVVPVHLYGQMADMDPIIALSEQYGLVVIEDACQAHGAEYLSRELTKQYGWQRAGSIGRAGAFSFYPGKNLGACGEAGAVTTNDAQIAAKIRMLRDHGQVKKYYHDIEGYNGRLDAIQAGVLHTKLKYLLKWNEQRRERALEYHRRLKPIGKIAVLPYEPSWSKGVYHLYVVRVEHREEFMAYLKSKDIGTAIHYPIPLHLQNAYNSLGYVSGDFPVSETIANQIVSLPIFPQITDEQQAKVIEEIFSFMQTEDLATDPCVEFSEVGYS